MLEIKDLRTKVDGKDVLKGVSLTVNAGEVHSIMGPNGSGKSTLSKALVGAPSCEITGGSVTYRGADLLAMEPEERSLAGLFLAYQYPVEIPGVNNMEFLRMAYNAKLNYEGKEETDPFDFEAILDEKMSMLGMDSKYRERSVNEGFSGGEKKKNEILQMALLEPKIAILDEIDSGLDIDALKSVADAVNKLRNEGNALIVITHYQRLLDYIVPDYVHVLSDGRITRSGGRELALELERTGYDQPASSVA
ncbi:Iron-sulfur cluster assembly ATPase protein SufC [hydrothermal vent metagenome]|uniref:Iron-sulfur cluster assembly ATPase protein SufC n=1 Tax=hydrothermal vent metagenome TaxID=652676 RepID=A0A3B1BJ62_9ZZZZ